MGYDEDEITRIINELRDLEEEYKSSIEKVKDMKKKIEVSFENREKEGRKIANVLSGQFYCGRCGVLMAVSDRLPYTMDVPDNIKHTIHRIKICNACYNELKEEIEEKKKRGGL